MAKSPLRASKLACPAGYDERTLRMAIFVVMVAADPEPRLLEPASLCPADHSHLAFSNWVVVSGLLAQRRN